jgi:hypothetical protein
MPTASLSVSVANRNTGRFVVVDTSDYTAVSVTSTSLKVVGPDNTIYIIDIYPANFASVNGTYNITPTILGMSTTSFVDGVYSFELTAITDGGTFVSSILYFLLDVNAIKCWAESYEMTIDEGREIEDEVRERRTEVRELIQAAREHFLFFRYSKATEAIERALYICQNEC